jgi:hypothetical protein
VVRSALTFSAGLRSPVRSSVGRRHGCVTPSWSGARADGGGYRALQLHRSRRLLSPLDSPFPGSIDGARALRVTSTYVRAFFTTYRSGRADALLAGRLPAIPRFIPNRRRALAALLRTDHQDGSQPIDLNKSCERLDDHSPSLKRIALPTRRYSPSPLPRATRPPPHLLTDKGRSNHLLGTGRRGLS